MSAYPNEAIDIDGRRVYSEIGTSRGASRTIERYITAGRPKRAAPADTYRIVVTTDHPQTDIARVGPALHRALNLRESDTEDLLRGTAAVLVDLDGSSFYLLVEFLKALGLFCSVGTVGATES